MHKLTYLLLMGLLSLSIVSIGQITPQQAIKEMARGINMGNTMEPPTEGGWNNVPAKEFYFEAYKNAGFSCVRIPIRWDDHTGKSSPFTIDEAWLDRVEEVIDWGLSRDLFIIINAHHENWFKVDYVNQKTRMDSIWTQIAFRFKDKSEKLFFEMMNEPRTDESTGLTQAQIDEFNARTLGIIRQHNPTRIVIFSGQGWCNSPDLIAAKVPNDPYLIGYFHSYDPWTFAGEGKGTWGTSSDYSALSNKFLQVQNWSKSKNVPVMIGEFGAHRNCDYNSRMKHYAAYVEKGLEFGFAYQAWDDGGNFKIMNRADTTWNDIKDILIYASDSTVNDLKLASVSDTLVNVTWTSRSETKTAAFIERRTLTTSFSVIARFGALSPTTFIDSTVNTGIQYYYRIVEEFGNQLIPSFPQTIYVAPVARKPYLGVSFAIPGTIEAEDYDKGGELLTYHDTDAANTTGAYRPNEGVDIEARTGGGYQIAYIEAGEWLEYTIDVSVAGQYELTAHTASLNGGGAFSVAFNGTQATTINIPSTGDWVTTAPTTAKVTLNKGQQIMRLTITKTPAYNIDKLVFAVASGIEENAEHNLRVYPNPTNTNLNIDCSGTTINQLLVYDASGKAITQLNLNAEKTILDVSDFKPGIYVIKAITPKGTVHNKFTVN